MYFKINKNNISLFSKSLSYFIIYRKATIFIIYIDLINIFLYNFILNLLKYIYTNNQTIYIINNKQLFYNQIHNLMPIELKILKIYINTNLVIKFI